jgi:hypothetical protein
VLHQGLNVFGPLAQRRHAQVDDTQTIVKILAELPGGHQIAEVPVGGSDHTNVDMRLGLIRNRPPDLSVLEEP